MFKWFKWFRRPISKPQPRRGSLADLVDPSLQMRRARIADRYPGFVPYLPSSVVDGIAAAATRSGVLGGSNREIIDFLCMKILVWQEIEILRAWGFRSRAVMLEVAR